MSSTQTLYTCPMHPEVEQPEPGECPQCGMSLEPIAGTGLETTKEGPSYTCPMHPEFRQCHPGLCPKCGMALELEKPSVATNEKEESTRLIGQRFYLALALTLPVLLLAMLPMVGVPLEALVSNRLNSWTQFSLTTLVLFWPGGFLFSRGLKSFLGWHLNMFSLIVLGIGAAYLFSVVGLLVPGIFPEAFQEQGGVKLYFESAAVIVTLIILGQMLEANAQGRTGEALRLLMQQAPEDAWRITPDGEETKVPVSELQVGDVLRVKPGEKLPVDGVIVEGHSHIDESMITGEPIPTPRDIGDTVTGGTLNATGSFLMRTNQVGDDTVLAQIVAMVAKAQRSKAPIQKVADRIAGWFVPFVMLSAMLAFAAWMVWGGEQRLAYAILNAVSVLIIACPCALGLATPISIMVGVGRGASEGILIKEAESLERLNKVDILCVDKTGTLTEGQPSLTDQLAVNDMTEAELIQYAASLEQSSEHPLATAIVTAARERGLALNPVEDFTSITGSGVRGRIAGQAVSVGRYAFLKTSGIEIPQAIQTRTHELEAAGRTVIGVSVNDTFAGLLAVSDPIKATSATAIRELHQLGLTVMMLTGDNSGTASHVAQALDIDTFAAALKPEEKIAKIKALKQSGKHVAMAGDGINDAPALAEATVGIAMGTGTDVAIESAGITLIKGDLRDIAKTIRLSRGIMVNIRQNLFFAFIYNGIGVPLAAGVLYPFFHLLLHPMFAAMAMSLSSLSVILNALRLKRLRLRGSLQNP